MLYKEPFVKRLSVYSLVSTRGIPGINGISTEPYAWMEYMTQNVSADRKLFSTAEACRISGLGRQYNERLLRQGRLAGIKPAHDWLVYEDSLHAFLAQPRKRGPFGPRKTLSPDLLTTSPVDADSPHQKKKRSGRGEVTTDNEG